MQLLLLLLTIETSFVISYCCLGSLGSIGRSNCCSTPPCPHGRSACSSTPTLCCPRQPCNPVASTCTPGQFQAIGYSANKEIISGHYGPLAPLQVPYQSGCAPGYSPALGSSGRCLPDSRPAALPSTSAQPVEQQYEYGDYEDDEEYTYGDDIIYKDNEDPDAASNAAEEYELIDDSIVEVPEYGSQKKLAAAAVVTILGSNEFDEKIARTSNCNDAGLRRIIEETLITTLNNLKAAKTIEMKATARYGGRFNAIVANHEFAFVNWYGRKNCQLRIGERYTLTWED